VNRFLPLALGLTLLPGFAVAAPRVIPGFATPESVLIDGDRRYVSNIGTTLDPLAKDGDGFISSLGADGTLIDRHAFPADGTTLDAPKGMAIVGTTLYVADITVVRKFDAKTGKALGEIKIDGSTFLNDVAPRKAGGVFVTDSGLTPKFESSGTDAIYAIDGKDKVTALAKSKALAAPNGIIEAGGKTFAVTFGSGSIYEVPAKGDPKPEKMAKGQLDGVIVASDGTFYVSSWEGKTIYKGKPGGKWEDLALDITSPADFGYDSKRNVLLVPSFQGNTVTIVTLKK